MGSELDDESKERRHGFVSLTGLAPSNKHKLKLFLIVILTNLLTLFVSRSAFPVSIDLDTPNNTPDANDEHDRLVTTLLRQLNDTNHEVYALQHQLSASGLLAQSLLQQLSRLNGNQLAFDLSATTELSLAASSHKLPLGFNPHSDSEKLFPSVGAGCFHYPDHTLKYMTYDVGGECPVDDVFAQKLILKGCEPLPRRRCRPKPPTGYVEPTPFPESLWATPPDTSIIWDPYSCKNYECLVEREKRPGIYDCKDCFNLQGREKVRWLRDNDQLDFSIERVLATKPAGSIRIGFDIGGGSGTFAARMRERNITILTSSMNLDGPFNNFIASRGLIPIHISVSQRFPFFDNTMDIVHSMHVLSYWIPEVMMEFLLYDIYRVLRPGGLFWLDRFYSTGEQLNQTYTPMIERVGFNKLRWAVGRKLDRGGKEWYLSAVLEKPMT